jgi:putative ABC transport system substrate-binding protein
MSVKLKRREFITLLGGAAVVWPRAARAQQTAMPVIGFLSSSSPANRASLIAAFRQGVRESGYVDGKSVAIEYRWAEDQYDRLPDLAADLVRRQVAVIAATDSPSTVAAKAATTTIPIVFMSGGDPVQLGLVASLSRPGGNITGFTVFGGALNPKRLELLSELVPQARVVAVLQNPTNGGSATSVEGMAADTQQVARTRGLQLLLLNAATADEIDAAFDTLSRSRVDAMLVTVDPFLSSRQQQLVTLAVRHAVPTMYVSRGAADAGGLVSYGANNASLLHDAAVYVGKILNGEEPADLPVQQPTKFELVINPRPPKRST